MAGTSHQILTGALTLTATPDKFNAHKPVTVKTAAEAVGQQFILWQLLAIQQSILEALNGVPLFLDEIGETPLVRVLQESEVVRIGAAHPIEVNLQIIAATHSYLMGAEEKNGYLAGISSTALTLCLWRFRDCVNVRRIYTVLLTPLFMLCVRG